MGILEMKDNRVVFTNVRKISKYKSCLEVIKYEIDPGKQIQKLDLYDGDVWFGELDSYGGPIGEGLIVTKKGKVLPMVFEGRVSTEVWKKANLDLGVNVVDSDRFLQIETLLKEGFMTN